MAEPRFTLQQVVRAVQDAKLQWQKQLAFTLLFRTFVGALVGFMIIGMMLVGGISSGIAVFGGATLTAFIFFTLDHTTNTFFGWLMNRLRKKEDKNDSDSSGSSEAD